MTWGGFSLITRPSANPQVQHDMLVQDDMCGVYHGMVVNSDMVKIPTTKRGM